MKKLFAIMITAVALAACNNEEAKEPAEPVEETVPVENSEMEDGLKADTEEQQYVAFADDEVAVNSKVKFLGKVTAENEGTFDVQSEASKAEDEIVRVKDIRLGERTDILEGFAVTVYGTYEGKDDEGVPVIKGIFIDSE